jgi:hypothetical protein
MPNQPFRKITSNPRHSRRTVIVLAALALYASGIHAAEPDAPMFSFSGFGTLGLVHSSEDQADFTSSVFKPNGAGYTHDWSPDVDSRLAAQVTGNFTPKLSAILQVISEQNYDNKYTPAVEWANIRYAFTPDFSVRAGRIVLPTFLVSDFRKVGYANPWVRPSVEVYGLVPITNNDGVDASYRLRLGEITNTVQVSYGSTEAKIVDGSEIEGQDQWGIFNTAEYGPLTIHLTYYQSNFSIESLGPLFDGFRQFGAEGIAIADKYECNGKRVRLAGLGGSYDPGNWFLMGEWARREGDCFIGGNTAWYVSGGFRFGKFTPYLTYAQTKADTNTSDPGLTVSALPPFLAGAATALNAGLNAALATSPVQKTISIGGRWDFRKNADLKLQYDHTRLGEGSAGVLINLQPGFQTGGEFGVFSAVVDFVF